LPQEVSHGKMLLSVVKIFNVDREFIDPISVEKGQCSKDKFKERAKFKIHFHSFS